MKRLLLFGLLLWSVPASSQAWSGILAPSRADANWPNAGAQGITSSAANCPTQPSSNTTLAISAAFTADAGGSSYCQINVPAGTYNISGSFNLKYAGKANIILNGAGPNQTFFVWTGNANFTCNGIGLTGMCVWNGDSQTNAGNSPWCNSATITGGLSQGSTTLTLSGTGGSCNPLTVGTLIQFAQQDFASDTGNIWYCDNQGTLGDCSLQGGAPVPYISGVHGNLNQENYVASCGATTWGATCTSSNVVLSSPVKSADWSTSRNPTAWWPATKPIENVGIQNMSLDLSAVSPKFEIECHDCKNVWFSGIRTVNNSTYPNSAAEHYLMWQGVNMSVFNSYLYGSNASSEGYGIDWDAGTSDSEAHNNIAQHVASAYMNEGDTGNVFAYNFATDNYFGSGWQQCDNYAHAGGSNFNLFEGNDGICIAEDDIHGTNNYETYYREFMNGYNIATYNFNCPSPCNNPPYESVGSGGQHYYDATVAIGVNAFSRYTNAVNNVFGTPGFHTIYNNIGLGGSPNSCPGFSFTVIYTLGFGNGNQHPNTTTCGGVGGNNGPVDNDTLASGTMMRWGNWDAVTGATRFCKSGSASPCTGDETASGAPLHPGLTNPSSTFPASFAGYSTTPSWWQFPNGVTAPFPANGSDVTGGVSNLGGHHYANPANNCYHNVMGGLDDGSSGPLTFNPTACYGSSTPTASQPTFSPGQGTYATTQSVTISTTTSGATICYTVDGSTPLAATPGTCSHGTTYSTAVSVSSIETINAIATKTALLNSAAGSAVYTISTPTLAIPIFSPDGNLTGDGYFLSNPSVTISKPSGSTACYTVDGSTPLAATPGTCSHGSTYSTAITVTATTGGTQLQAIATESGFVNSAVTSSTYFLRNIVVNGHNSTNGGLATLTSIATTLSSVPSGDGIACQVVIGTASPPVSISVSDSQNGAYTACIAPIYAAGPAASVGKFFVSGAASGSPVVTASFSQAVQFVGIACKDLKPATAGTMFCDPSAGPSPATVPNSGTTPTTGAGTTPVHANEFIDCGLLTSSGSSIGGSGYFLTDQLPGGPNLFPEYQIQNTAAAANCPYAIPSAQATSDQQIGYYFAGTTPAATPTMSPAPGTYSTVQTITLSCTTASPTMYYTEDGTTPTTGSTQYTGPFTLSISATLRAICTASGFSTSPVGSATYTINAGLQSPPLLKAVPTD